MMIARLFKGTRDAKREWREGKEREREGEVRPSFLGIPRTNYLILSRVDDQGLFAGKRRGKVARNAGRNSPHFCMRARLKLRDSPLTNTRNA